MRACIGNHGLLNARRSRTKTLEIKSSLAGFNPRALGVTTLKGRLKRDSPQFSIFFLTCSSTLPPPFPVLERGVSVGLHLLLQQFYSDGCQTSLQASEQASKCKLFLKSNLLFEVICNGAHASVITACAVQFD